MITVTEHRLQRADGTCLHAHLRSSGDGASKPVMIFAHGFITNGLENHRMFMRAAREFGREGFSSVLLDFYGTGYSDGDYVDFRLSGAALDLAATTHWAAKEAPCDGTVVLLGQSLGTAVCVVSLQELRVPVAALIFWNLSGDFRGRYPKLFGAEILDDTEYCIERKGYRIGAGFLEDAASHDIMALLTGRPEPALFINCEGDGIGNSQLAIRAGALMTGPTKRIAYPDATHSFWCQPELEERAIRDSVEWLHTIRGGGIGPSSSDESDSDE